MIEPAIKLNPSADCEIRPIGDAGQVVIVDDFLLNPQELIDFAVTNSRRFTVPPKSYPGFTLPLSPSSSQDVQRFIRSTMSKHFGFLRGGIGLTTILSMTTLAPHQLSNLQRLCHTDPKTAPDRQNYAALVYLFEDGRLGGTGFYRWKQRELIEEATALELQNPAAALEFLQAHFPTYNEPAAYLTASNEIVELIDVVPAKFNRFVFYAGDVPHSAYIAHPERLTDNFREGRLTLNFFASVVPRQP